MPSFLIELWPTEKSYRVPFKEISLCSSFVKSFDTTHKQKLDQLMLYLLQIYKYLFHLHTSNSRHHCNGK